MGWKLTTQQQPDVNLERESLSAQDVRLELNNNNNNRRRNALTVCFLREELLQELGVRYSLDNQRNRREAEGNR